MNNDTYKYNRKQMVDNLNTPDINYNSSISIKPQRLETQSTTQINNSNRNKTKTTIKNNTQNETESRNNESEMNQTFFSSYFNDCLANANNETEKILLKDLYESFKPLENLIKNTTPDTVSENLMNEYDEKERKAS